MLIERSDAEPRCRMDAVQSERRLRGLGRGGVVAALEVRAGFIHRGETGAERCGRLRGLSRRLLLRCPFEELLKPHVVLSRLGQQGGWVLLGKQAWLGDGSVSDSHECLNTQVKP